jgi:hypothetical protein
VPSRRPQPWLVPTLALLVVLPIGLGVWTAVSSRSGGGDDGDIDPPTLSRAGSTVVHAASAPFAFGDEPTAYAITYRLEQYRPDRVQVTEDRVEVRRPFDARVVSRVDGRVTATRASRLGALVVVSNGRPLAITVPPAPATSDVRVITALADAERLGFVDRRERRRVHGRECQVFRAGSTVAAGVLTPVGRGSNGEHADVCVGRDGLVLEEVWVKGGRAIQRRVATEVAAGVAIADDRFHLDGEAPIGVEQGDGTLQRIDAASGLAGTTYRLPAAPSRYEYQGRYLVQPPKLGNGGEQAGQVSQVDVWTNGPDVLTLSQTVATSGAAIPQPGPASVPVGLGPLGPGDGVVDLRANEVRVQTPGDGPYLRLAGQLPIDALVGLARSLQPEHGTGPRPVTP